MSWELFSPWILGGLKLGGLALIFALLVAIPFLLPNIIQVLNNIAEKIKSEKIRVRVKDAIEKVGIVIGRLVEAESAMYRKEIIEILKNGKIENEEIKALAEKIAKTAMEMLKGELPTLKNYFVGEMAFDFIVKTTTSYLVSFVQSKLEKTPDPFPPAKNQ